MPQNKLYIIEPGASLRLVPDHGELEYKCPKFDFMKKLIGPKCDLIEHVWMPHGIYKERHMFVDESGLYHDLELNRLASLLAGQPIVGTALIWEGEME